MKIGKGIDITKKKTGEIVFIYKNHTWSSETRPELEMELQYLYRLMTRTREDLREQTLVSALKDNATSFYPQISKELNDTGENLEEKVADLERGLENLLSFFTEFQYQPNFRFVNTLARKLAKSDAAGKTYVSDYFRLIDSPYIHEITAKMKSDEFKNILFDLKSKTPAQQINNRLKLYYGPQGTGKTTAAQAETGGRLIVCNSSMLPSDLMEDFKFNDGKATFEPSVLWTCMENGEQITLDEINLLPFDSLRFLQGILDGKTEFTYKNREVHIKDGFKIVGTMNLSVNGITYGLPEPLVDRCEDMREFKLTAKDLLGAF